MTKTREQKIEALWEKYPCGASNFKEIYLAGVHAGIRLRDEELGEMAVEFNEAAFDAVYQPENNDDAWHEGCEEGARWQFDRDKAALGLHLSFMNNQIARKDQELHKLRELLAQSAKELDGLQHNAIVRNGSRSIYTPKLLEKIKAALGVGDE